MNGPIDAIFENGKFRPLQPEGLALTDGQRVRITVDDAQEPQALQLAMKVFEGLSDEDVNEIERVALDRRDFFAPRSGD